MPMVPSSFATQMALATGGLKHLRGNRERERERGDGEAMMGRLMLARMKTLEEGFAEVVREFRGMRTAGNSSVEGEGGESWREREKGKGKERERGVRRRKEGKDGLVRTKSDFDVTRAAAVGGGDERREDDEIVAESYLTKGSSL